MYARGLCFAHKGSARDNSRESLASQRLIKAHVGAAVSVAVAVAVAVAIAAAVAGSVDAQTKAGLYHASAALS